MYGTKLFILILSLAFITPLMGQKLDHSDWTALLQKHVDEKGVVNYKGFIEDKKALNKYLNYLGNNHAEKSWSEEEQLAYWINVYNAFAIKLVIEHYPVSSIQRIGGLLRKPWHIEFIKIGDKTYSLDYVEHKILRVEFDEPRIHFGVNCASFSCPILYTEAFTAENVDEKLDKLARLFINDPKRNKISKDRVELSKIFDWFKEDFTKNGTLIDYINKYSETKVNKDAKISFMSYDWSLNE